MARHRRRITDIAKAARKARKSKVLKSSEEDVVELKQKLREAMRKRGPGLLPGQKDFTFRFTPRLALAFVERMSSRNPRRLSMPRVMTLVAEMQAGRWETLRDAIEFDSNLEGRNGRTRLMAVYESGKAQTFIVVVGVKDSQVKVSDQGKSRTVRDTHGIGCTESALTNMVNTLLEGNGPKLSNGAIADLYDQHYEHLHPAVLMGSRNKSLRRACYQAPIVLALRHCVADPSRHTLLMELVEELADFKSVSHGASSYSRIVANFGPRAFKMADQQRLIQRLLNVLMHHVEGKHSPNTIFATARGFNYFAPDAKITPAPVKSAT